MNEFNITLEKGKSGYFIDGRTYEIVDIPSIFISTSGTFKYGDVKLFIDEELHTLRISEFLGVIATMGDLSIRDMMNCTTPTISR